MHSRQSPGRARLWMIAIFLAATAAPALAQEQVTITGTIAAKTTGEPLAGAFVTIVETGATALTDAQGAYKVEVPPGSYTMSVEMIGFTSEQRPITVEPGGPATMDFQLPDDPRFAEVIVVVGSRTERSQIATPVPVDVITAEAIAESGQTETNQVLATVAPSYQASHQAISDGTDHIDPASLRGLGPDQTLVLVNGKRRHSSALLNVNGTFGRGTVGVDLNAIPTSAIARIEVLRDGAASQYGSDAIAGVVNIVLKDYAEVGEVSAATGITGSGDGEQFKAGANYGVRLGKSGGYLNLTGEFVGRGRTNRTDPWDGQIFAEIPDAINDSTDNAATDAELERLGLTRRDFTMEVGQSGALVGMLYMNAMYPLGEDLEAYAFGGYTYRKGYASGFYRLPSQEDRNVPEVYEFGFLPEINPVLNDLSATTGLRATWGKWNSDYSVSYGSNAFQYFIDNSINASLGADSPTSFDAGTLSFAQTMANADFLRTIETSAFKALSLVFGGEYRHENFAIGAGQEESYIAGDELTDSGKPKAPGAQVFPGFQPANAISAVRESQSAYVGVESELSERFLLDLGGRFEHYTDFGNALIGKVAGRFSVIKDDNREVALRAAANTGFRAPSLHQIWFSSVSTQFVTNPATMELEPREVLNSNNLDPVTAAFGIPRLDQETSLNFSAGITAKPIKNLTVSADFYRIAIDDRIVLTTQFATGDRIIGQQIADVLSDFPQVSAAQFFSNAVDTVTNGVDLVVDYGIPMRKGSLSLTASANFTKTLVTDVHLPDTMVEKFSGADEYWLQNLVFFTREERNRLEDALPRQKGSLTVRYARGPITGVARGSYYGSVTGKSAVGPDEVERYPEIFDEDDILDETFGAKVLFDLDLSYKLGKLRLGIGANNLLNTFPDQQTLPGNVSGGRFIYSRRVSQFGINGGFYYLRMQYLL